MNLSERVRNAIANEGPRTNNADALAAELAELEAKLLAHIENEGDECPLCNLKVQVASLREDAGVIIVGDGLRVGKAWVENLKANHERLLKAGEDCWPHMFRDIPKKGMKRTHYEKFYGLLKNLLNG